MRTQRPPRRRSIGTDGRAWLWLAALVTAFAALRPLNAFDPGPQNVVREFSRLDADGARLLGGRWRELAPLVAWPLEPAWDRVLLITGYQIGTTRPLEGGRLAVDVDYAVVGEASALGFEAVSYIDRVTFVLATTDEVQWYIVSPMVAPHVFGSRTPPDEIVASLAKAHRAFVSSSLFVNQLMRAAGWDVPYEPAADLLNGRYYAPTDDPQPGDLVVYTHDGVAYHAGILVKQGRVVSSTLNAAIVRTTVNAFLGQVHYLRLVEPVAVATPTVVGR